MISTAAAQPLPAVSAPLQSASSPTPPASLPPSVTVPVSAGYNAITVELKPADKKTALTDPSVIAGFLPALAVVGALVTTMWQLKAGRNNLDKQLEKAKESQDESLRQARDLAEKQREQAAVLAQKQLDQMAANLNDQLDASRKSAERQFADAREKAHMDRTLAARATTITEFIDAFKEVSQLIGDLPNLRDLQAGNIQQLQNMNAVVNKLWLWVGVSTVHYVREMQADINEFFFDALIERKPILAMYPAIEFKQEELARTKAATEKTFVSAAHKKIADDAHLKKALEMADLLALNTQRRGVYLKFVGDRSEALMDRMNILMRMVRVELHVPGDTKILDEQTQIIKQRLQAAIERVRAATEPKNYG